jgi:hypothetical protein
MILFVARLKGAVEGKNWLVRKAGLHFYPAPSSSGGAATTEPAANPVKSA